MADRKGNSRVEELISKLNLGKHPAGMGYLVESYRSEGTYQIDDVSRNFSAMIYYLLPGEEYNTWHKLKTSDEYFCFYEGSPMHIFTISPDSNTITTVVLGRDVTNGEVFHVMIPAGTWMAAQAVEADSYTLVGATTVPGFSIQDAVVATAKDLEHVKDPRVGQYLAK